MPEIANNLLLEGYVQPTTPYISQYHELPFNIQQNLDQKSLTLEGLAQA
jgi:hypothetical protein